MNVTIKVLSNDSFEIKKVQKFLFKQIKKEFGYGYIPEWHQDIVNMEDYYISPDKNDFFIAYDENDKIIASIGIRGYDKNFSEFDQDYSKDKTASIWRLFVDEKYRRCGLASKMFNVAEEFANKKNYESIYLHTHKTLPGAIEFWKKMGFIIFLDENDELKTVHMDKIIHELNMAYHDSAFNYAVEF